MDAFADRSRDAYLAAARRALRTPLLAVAAAASVVLRAIAGAAGRIRRLALYDRAGKGPSSVSREPSTASLDVRHALLELLEHGRHRLPWFWAERLRDTADRAGDALPTALKAALAGVDIAPIGRRWWMPLAAASWLAELTAAIGILWLLLAWLTAWLQMPRLPVPAVGDDSTVPGVMIAVGVTLWVAAALVRTVSLRAGARRHRQSVERRARGAVRRAVHDTTLAPLLDEVGAYERARAGLTLAAA